MHTNWVHDIIHTQLLKCIGTHSLTHLSQFRGWQCFSGFLCSWSLYKWSFKRGGNERSENKFWWASTLSIRGRNTTILLSLLGASNIWWLWFQRNCLLWACHRWGFRVFFFCKGKFFCLFWLLIFLYPSVVRIISTRWVCQIRGRVFGWIPGRGSPPMSPWGVFVDWLAMPTGPGQRGWCLGVFASKLWVFNSKFLMLSIRWLNNDVVSEMTPIAERTDLFSTNILAWFFVDSNWVVSTRRNFSRTLCKRISRFICSGDTAFINVGRYNDFLTWFLSQCKVSGNLSLA